MKKLVALLLVLVMCGCFAGVASAGVSDVDLASMSLDELAELKTLINNEISARTGMVDNFYSGFFVGGTDIKVGNYVLTMTIDSDRYGNVYLYKDMDDYEQNEGYPYEAQYFREKGQSCMIVINEGTVVKLENFEGTIERIGATEWAP